MPRWAVSHINFMDHELSTNIVEGETWSDAALQHPMIAEMFPSGEYNIPDLQAEAKKRAFDSDAMINVVLIP